MKKMAKQLIDVVKQDAVELCYTMGLTMKQSRDSNDQKYVHMPFSMFPSPFPAEPFHESLVLQPLVGKIVAGIVRNPAENIFPVLDEISKLDDFLARLLQISRDFNTRKAAGEPVQNIHMCILRSDYMIDWPQLDQKPLLKLVEFNTVAVSLLPQADRVNKLQQIINHKYTDDLSFNYVSNFNHYLKTDPAFATNPIFDDNYSQTVEMARSFADAINLYRQTVPGPAKPWVLFIIDHTERNVTDQKNIEATLQIKFGVFTMRATLLEVGQNMKIDNNLLYFKGHEIGLVYFRTGYQMEQYDTGSKDIDGWHVRTLIENSMAIKCPSIDVQLATFKKYQQAFSDESLLQQVTQSEEVTKQASHLFKGIWSLEDFGKPGAEVNIIFEDALAHPEKYVLKPQKEGGGNNFFGAEIV